MERFRVSGSTMATLCDGCPTHPAVAASPSISGSLRSGRRTRFDEERGGRVSLDPPFNSLFNGSGPDPAKKRVMKINDTISLGDWELSERFGRARGPGGQNVNKVATAVELRFEAARSPNLPASVKARLRNLAGRRWTLDGAIVIQVDETRSQARNRAIARERLAELILGAAVSPKRRIPTMPSAASKRRWLRTKKKRGEVKALRERIKVGSDDG